MTTDLVPDAAYEAEMRHQSASTPGNAIPRPLRSILELLREEQESEDVHLHGALVNGRFVPQTQ